MLTKLEHELVSAITRSAHPLTGETTDFDPLLRAIGDSRFVLIGEATHGTHEFYRLRGQITKRLIAEKGFNAVAVEADRALVHVPVCDVVGRITNNDVLEERWDEVNPSLIREQARGRLDNGPPREVFAPPVEEVGGLCTDTHETKVVGA